MNKAQPTLNETQIKPVDWNLYKTVWRWHFYCGLIFLPFIMILCITGGIYLFQDEYEAMAYHELMNVEAGQNKLTDSQLLTIVKNQYPGHMIMLYKTPADASHSVEMLIAPMPMNGQKISVFIDPYTGKILGDMNNNTRLMELMKDIHGNMFAGKVGTKFVETAACWTIVLMITGLFMWWPRPKFSVWGTLLPRLNSGKRLFWRDLHGVSAFYFSFFILFLLITGLPWTDVWGGSFGLLQKSIGQNEPASFFAGNINSTVVEGQPKLSLDQVISSARSKGLDGRLMIKIANKKDGVYSIMRDSDDSAKRIVLIIDQYSGEIIHDVRWANTPFLARAVALGVKLHRGEYFGFPNQMLALATAVVLLFICISAMVMWWQRRPAGTLGAPASVVAYDKPKWLTYITVLLALVMPMLLASLLLFLLADWLYSKFKAKSQPVYS